ncbi:MAG TPA: hypothetical protein VK957_19270 [Lunatimonas sp.]|nr:hypothetical protein [Lunatimonas sp.]
MRFRGLVLTFYFSNQLGTSLLEPQTLTSDAESNFLKLFEMMNMLGETQSNRWASIKETFVKNNKIRGLDSDRMAQVIGQISPFVEGLEGIRKVLS